MAKTIAVSDETYELLKNSKGEHESFSEVITRNLKKRPRLMDIAGSGVISKRDWEKAEKLIKKAELKTEREFLGTG